MVANTLKLYDESLYNALLDWFISNSYNITDFCFSRGLAEDEQEFAEYIWYKNEMKENSLDEIISIKELCSRVEKHAEELTFYGTQNGGTTIQLPFGFVQWHSPTKVIPGCMQFHHKYGKISALINN